MSMTEREREKIHPNLMLLPYPLESSPVLQLNAFQILNYGGGQYGDLCSTLFE